ncbi:MAG: hypothetical protein HY908_17195 [Myxococcales bacterium]|nr:hypothetical protein [Myxococcales bacterium]
MTPVVASTVLAVALAGAAASACSGGGPDGSPTAASSSGLPATASSPPSSAARGSEPATSSRAAGAAAASAAAPVDWAAVPRTPPATLEALLPATAAGFARKSSASEAAGSGAEARTEASAEYAGPKDATVRLVVQDNPLRAEDILSERSGSFRGHPVVGAEESSDEADFAIVVAGRFVVIARGANVKLAALRETVGKLDLDKLAAWRQSAPP